MSTPFLFNLNNAPSDAERIDGLPYFYKEQLMSDSSTKPFASLVVLSFHRPDMLRFSMQSLQAHTRRRRLSWWTTAAGTSA